MTTTVHRRIRQVLDAEEIQPVVADVGASGGPPVIWGPIATQSHYIGFDPDLREIKDEYGGAFARSTMVAEAVTPDVEQRFAEFRLTRSPFCSSVLEPDLESLNRWTFRDLFEVTSSVSVPATTLDLVLDRLGLSGVDWLKLDTQGTDLRIVQSISPERMKHLIAIDVEPGLIDAYQDEDLFVDTHRVLVESGFWLSRLSVQGSQRASVSTMDAIKARDPLLESRVRRVVRRSPGWCEARYLRTVDSVAWHAERDALLLWVFSLLDDQPGAALDVSVAWERRFGRSELLDQMDLIVAEMVAPSVGERLAEVARRRLPMPVRRIARRLRAGS